MVEIKTTYSADTTFTLDLGLTPLASSATFIAGRESTQIDNTSNLYVDAIVHGFITTGTSPTVSTLINVYVWGNYQSLGTLNIDTLDGTDSDETLTNTGILNSMLRLGASIVVSSASNIKYDFAPFSVAELFGGIMPKFWGLFIAHNTVAALHTTSANHVFKFNGITYTSA